MMKKTYTTQKGNRYLTSILKTKPKTITRVKLWDIYKTQPRGKNICLKLGRYKNTGSPPDTLEVLNPRSELTLDSEEFQNLLHFLRDNYEPFREGFDSFIPLGGRFDQETIDALTAIVDSPAKKDFLDFIANNEILANELMSALQSRTRIKAVEEFKSMLGKELDEDAWQKWFMRNDWVLGSEFVRVLEERAIDTANITDYLMQAYDGFLDIVEIKRPEGGMKFWADKPDHGNCVQSTHLTKAITQAITYISELEREANSVKFLERVGIKAIKPRCTLIFGRSEGWNDDQKEAYRILNATHKDLNILTYDHVLDRAKRIVGMNEPIQYHNNKATSSDDDDIPF